MDVLLDWQHYHRLNISLLSLIGLWPFGNKVVLMLKRVLGSFFVLLCCFSQLAALFTRNYTMRVFLRNVPYIFVGCCVLVKYMSFLGADDSIKRIMEGINGDQKALSSKDEIRIVKKYVKRGKFHTKVFAMFICPLGLCLVLLPFSPVFLDIVMPLNETRSRSFPFMFELFVDQKEHFFLVAFLYDGMIIAGVFVFLSTEALLIVYIQHACAFFEVTSCRIRKLLGASGVSDSKYSSNLVIIANVVNIHCRAISEGHADRFVLQTVILRSKSMWFNGIYTNPHRYCKSLKEDFLPSYLILLVFGILSLGAYIFCCIKAFACHEFTECFISMMFCVAILGYIFFVNFMLQNIQDSSGDIFNNLCNTAWWNVPITTRKLILFCMVNCIKPVILDASGLFVPCYTTFSMILRTTMSFATALFSLQ